MSNKLEVKHKEPKPLQMFTEYGIMFSRDLMFYLAWFGLIGVGLLIYIYGPSTINPSTNLFLRIFAFINAYFFYCGSGFLFLALMLPLIARLIFPSVIMILEVIRMLLLGVQLAIDELLISTTTKFFLYPKLKQEDTKT